MAERQSNQCLAIGYPHPGVVQHCFMDSYINFREYDRTHSNILGAVIRQQGMYIAGQRNRIVKDFLEKTSLPWLLCMDSDHTYAPEVPYLLIQSAEENNARVMSALYFGIMAGDASPMWWNVTPQGDFHTVQTIVEGVQEIQGFGMGMVLIHRSVFEEMAPRYSDDTWKWFGHDMTVFHGEQARFGEDLCFCNRLRDMGIKMYGDSRIIVGHNKTINLDFETFLKLVKQRKEGEPEISERVLDPIV